MVLKKKHSCGRTFHTVTPPIPTSTYYLETIRFITDKWWKLSYCGTSTERLWFKTDMNWKSKLFGQYKCVHCPFSLICNKLKSKEGLLPAKISRPPIKGSIGMLRVQQRATNEMMKAMMRMMRPMIIRAATAWAHAGGTTKNKTFISHAAYRFHYGHINAFKNTIQNL